MGVVSCAVQAKEELGLHDDLRQPVVSCSVLGVATEVVYQSKHDGEKGFKTERPIKRSQANLRRNPGRESAVPSAGATREKMT